MRIPLVVQGSLVGKVNFTVVLLPLSFTKSGNNECIVIIIQLGS